MQKREGSDAPTGSGSGEDDQTKKDVYTYTKLREAEEKTLKRLEEGKEACVQVHNEELRPITMITMLVSRYVLISLI